jgi:hypothetical protein
MLCPRNNDVDPITEVVLNSLDAQVKTYLDVHSIRCEDEGYLPLQSESYLRYF